jgi:hypothetical protein
MPEVSDTPAPAPAPVLVVKRFCRCHVVSSLRRGVWGKKTRVSYEECVCMYNTKGPLTVPFVRLATIKKSPFLSRGISYLVGSGHVLLAGSYCY